jgi:hypothetical protein
MVLYKFIISNPPIMPKGKRYTKRELPPNPDPERYIVVKTRDRLYHYRLKRGSIKPAFLNGAFLQNQQLTSLLSPAAKKVRTALWPYTENMKTPKLHNQLLTGLKKYYKEFHQPGFKYLRGLNLQHQYPLDKLLHAQINKTTEAGNFIISFLLNDLNFPKVGPLLTDYYFEAVLLFGDILGEEPMQELSQRSELFSFSEPPNQLYTFSFQLPHQSWMLLLKAACFERDQKATNPKYYGMQIIETG